MTALPYTDDHVTSPEGIACRVLDVAALDFSGAATGRKATETLVRRAAGGEKIVTRNTAGLIESVYETKPGDAIFINLHNPDDAYVPGNADGTRWQFSELAAKGYEITGEDAALGGVRVKSNATFKILHEAVASPTCVRDAWGPGQHAFLHAGATLKLNANGSVSGIDKTAFDATWEVLQPATALRKAKQPQQKR